MKWRKLGKIFDPAEHELPHHCVGFAQSPQALIFDDFVRIYFSTRAVDPANGKYVSHIAYADMDKQFAKILRLSSGTVIAPGNLGCFDEHGIFPMNIVRYGNKVYAYTCGWNRRVSVSVDTSIGLAISSDNGVSFEKVGHGPVLTSSLREPFLVGDPFVRILNGTFHMWYIYGTHWKTYPREQRPERIYKIGHAVSQDGVAWRKDGKQLISDAFDDECQAHPSVVDIGNRHHMVFCRRQASDFRNNRERSYRLGYAYSDDLAHWVRDDSLVGIEVTPGGWDSDMMCYPHLFRCDGRVYLLYNGNEFGKYGFGLAQLEAVA